MILVSFILALGFTLFVLTLRRFPSRVGFLLAGYLVFFGQIVFVFLIANSFRALTAKWLVLDLQFALLLAGSLAWMRAGRPSLRYLLPGRWRLPDRWRGRIKDWLPVVLLGLGLAAGFALGAILIVVVAPNNNDALTSHLSRIGFWLQHNSFFPWPTLRLGQPTYPVNGSLQVYWTVLFWGTDQLAGFVQWTGGIVTILCVFGLARLLGWSRLQSAFAAFIWGSFPIILLQSTTAQLDLVAAGIFLPGIYFLVLGVKRENQAMLVYSGLSLGLAMGTKQTLWLLVPGLGLLALSLIGYWIRHVRHFMVWAGATLSFFLVLSAYMFVVNQVYYKTPVGPPDYVSNSALPVNTLNRIGFNIPRLLYQAVDFSGLPEFERLLAIKVKSKITGMLDHRIGYMMEGTVATAEGHQFDLNYRPRVSEDESWFGILSVLLLFPAAVLEFITGLRSRDGLRIGLFLFSLSFLFMEVILRPWDLYQGRYFITPAAALAPFMARWVQRKNPNRVIIWVSMILGIMSIFNIMVFNYAKPLRSDRLNMIMESNHLGPFRSSWFDIFRAPRMITQGLRGGSMQLYMQMVYSLPENAPIAYYAEVPFWDFPLFGEHFTRKVFPLVSLDALLDASQLQALGIEYVYIDLTNTPSLETIDPRLHEYAREDGHWIVYKLDPP
jgi:4-amino-4-deoxy-L-arabinose transferase-like glycosyltransferase